MNNEIINKQWKKYFNFVILYPTILLSLTIVLLIIFLTSLFNETLTIELTTFIVVLFAPVVLLFSTIIGTMLLFIYMIWYFVISDSLFQLLELDRIMYNIINIVLFLTTGILIMPIIMYIQIKKYWKSQLIESDWRGFRKE